MGAPTYRHSFTVDRIPLPATNKVRPWREYQGGKVAESVRKGLLLPEDMKWDDDSLLLNMKREAIMVTNSSPYFYCLLHFSFSFLILSSLYARGINAPW